MRMSAVALLAGCALASPALAQGLALKRVMLSSAGVGYFEYEAEVDGATTLGLDVKLDQVDDVLKSLVVFDQAGGVGSIVLPGRDDSHGAFGDVPFGPEALSSPLALLNSLQGTEVSVQGTRPMTGRILRAETVHDAAPPNMPAPASTRVTLLTAEGLQQFVLETSDAVQVTDPSLRGRITQALAASRRQASQDGRHVSLRVDGAGHRVVRVSFVAAAPLWKASYRLVLPPVDADPAHATARLQGWATLENQTSSDWSAVALSVQYGNPVTFRQAIYRSYFVPRPEVPVEVPGRLLPDVDTRARPAPPPPPPPPAGGMQMQALPSPAAMPPAAPAMAEPRMAPPAEAAVVQEGAEETVFAVASPVSLAAGYSASVPIADVVVPAARVALLSEGQSHPLAAIRLRNTTASSLPAGVLTLYGATADMPYAGDARLGGLPVGETRLLPYAQDLRTAVEWRHEDSTTIASLAAAAGVLRVDERQRQVTHAVLSAPAGEPRHVLLAVDKAPGATLAAGFAQPAEETATAWRFAVDLRPGEVREVTYAVDTHDRQEIAMLDDADAVAAVLNLQGASPAARAALAHVGELRAQEAARAAERDALVSQRDAVDKDEERLRANLGAVSAADAVRTRLVRQLDADETRHAQLDSAVAAAEGAVTKAHTVLEDAVSALRL